MSRTHLFRAGSALLIGLVLCMCLSGPSQVAASARSQTGSSPAPTFSSDVYLASSFLLPNFQSTLDQQTPDLVNSVLNTLVNQMPTQDRGWAAQMAGALLQPQATITSLTPQQQGLQANLALSLYAGDPKPMSLSLLTGFSVLNPSTLQISALSTDGPSLASGPLGTLPVAIGQVNNVAPTPNCGNADLKLNMTFPLGVGQTTHASNPATNAYIEIPANSLAQIGPSFGVMTINSALTARNIRVSTQGHNIVATAEIDLFGLPVASTVSTVAPEAVQGSLTVRVLGTQVFPFSGPFSFPLNSFNHQIEQTFNARLGGATAGHFLVASAAIGPNPQLPCVAAGSLVLGGTLLLN